MPTVSEQLFEQLCSWRGISFHKLPEGQSKSPDYRLSTTKGAIICEIKQIDANDHDRQIIERWAKFGRADLSRAIGKRARVQIKEAADQLRIYESHPIPKVVVIYDNVSNLREHPYPANDLLGPLDMDAAMFGEPIVRFWSEGKPAGYDLPDFNHGGNRRLTESRGLYFSAVIALLKTGQELSFAIYHNPFATVVLEPGHFPDSRDIHYVKLGHPDRVGSDWVEYVGPR